MIKLSRLATCVALSLAAFAAESARADRIDMTVPLGATKSGVIAAPGDLATVGFLVTQGTGRKLVLTVKRAAKTSKLVPDVTVVAPDGSAFDLPAHGGTVTAAGKVTWLGKLPNVVQSGLWRLEIRGAAGTTGAFAVVLKGSDTFKLASPKGSSQTIPQGGKADIAIEAGENVALTVSAKRGAGSSVVPQLAIIDSAGRQVDNPPSVVNTKAGSVTLKAYRLPVFGKYTLRFTGAGGGGGTYSYSVSTAAAKIKGTIPTADGGAGFDVEPGADGTLDGSHSVTTGGQPGFRWVQVSGPDAVIASSGSSKTTFTAPNADTSIAFQLSVSTNGVFSRPVTIPVEVTKKPLADAGRPQSVAVSTSVSLDGSGSIDRGTRPLKYSWKQMPNDPASVTLTGADKASPTFTSPSSVAHALHFSLKVDNGRALSDEDLVTVAVGDPTVSIADAGRDQVVPLMASVCLCGLGSVSGSGVLDGPVLWTQVGGPHLKDRNGNDVDVEGNDTLWPSFTAPRAEADLEFKLTVNGDAATAATCRVHVRGAEPNLPVNARGNGPLNAVSGPVGMTATIDVAQTDPISYRWGQVAGPAATLTNPAAASATATIAAGVNAYQFAVQANDGLQYGMPDLVAVRNAGFNAAPIAIAGVGPDRVVDLRVTPAAVVTLDGRNSVRTDGGSAPLSFQWTQVSGKDWYVPTINATAAAPTFTLPADVSSLTLTRTIVFKLVVNDGTHSSLPDFVSVTWQNLPFNGRPTVTASVSNSNPLVGDPITLDCSPFDRDGDPMTIKWTQTKGTTIALSPNNTAKSPTFVAPASGDLEFKVFVNDGFQDSLLSAPVSVKVDQKPIANIVVSPLSGPPGTNVTMDGSSSSDAPGETAQSALVFKWTQTLGTPITGLNLSAAVVSFSAPTTPVGFRLVVNDGRQDSDPKTAGFSSVQPPTVAPTATRSNLPSPAPSPMTAAYGATVTLAANASPSPSTYNYVWRVVSQSFTTPTITLSSTTAQNPTFSVPMPSTTPFGTSPTATFGVTATSADGTQSSGESTVVVNFYASLNDTGQVSSTNTIYGIVGTTCAVSGCHSGTSNTCPVGSGSGYGLGTLSAFLNNSRTVPSCAAPSSTRLPGQGNPSTGNSTNSYLFGRLLSSAGSLRMPQGSALSTTQINFFQDWIDQGVNNN